MISLGVRVYKHKHKWWTFSFKFQAKLNKGEHLFPTSYYVVDVITGFQSMDAKSSQRHPRVLQKEAFKSTFGVTYMQPTYQKARRLYEDNVKLASELGAYGRTKRGTWSKFRAAVESGMDESSGGSDDTDSEVVDGATQQELPVFLDATSNTADEGSSPHDGEEDIDWRQRCNYCDKQLPLHPSEKLLDLQDYLNS